MLLTLRYQLLQQLRLLHQLQMRLLLLLWLHHRQLLSPLRLHQPLRPLLLR